MNETKDRAADRKQLDMDYYEALGAQIADEMESADDPLPSSAHDDPNPALRLRRLALRKRLLEQRTDAQIAESVRELRDRGMSWNKIGRILDLTGEAARKRYQNA